MRKGSLGLVTLLGSAAARSKACLLTKVERSQSKSKRFENTMHWFVVAAVILASRSAEAHGASDNL
jgi:hypothetical protein